MNPKASLVVHGKPHGQPRHRLGGRPGRRTLYQPHRAAEEWKLKINHDYAVSDNPHFGREPLTVQLVFFFDRPKRKKLPAGMVPYTSKPDCDNLAKAVLDALNGVAWHDDAQIFNLLVEKWYVRQGGHPSGVLIDIYTC